METDFKIDALVGIDCEMCGNKSLIPPLQVEPGVKCQHCGAVLTLDERCYAERTALLIGSKGRKDVNLG